MPQQAQIRWHKPSTEELEAFRRDQASRGLTYDAVGATAGTPPRGFLVDRASRVVGRGAAAFAAARRGIQQWRHFDLGWMDAWPENVAIQPGETVGVLVRYFGLWWLNAARIVYIIDESGPVERFGFAYGTLPGHAERGEERFLVEWDHASDDVTYHIFSFARPRHPLAVLGYPLIRRLQHRFRHDSLAALQRFVRAEVCG